MSHGETILEKLNRIERNKEIFEKYKKKPYTRSQIESIKDQIDEKAGSGEVDVLVPLKMIYQIIATLEKGYRNEPDTTPSTNP